MTDLIKNNNFHALSQAFETDKLDALLEEAAARTGRGKHFRTKKSFAPSGIGYGSGKCPRYWYKAFHGAEFDESASARDRANMDSGTAAGTRIANLFKEAGILNAAEVKVVHEDPPIFGFMDLAVTWQGEEMIGEVKTTKAESWNYRASTMKPPGYQLLQLLIYMRVFKKDKGFFVIENKNTHELLILPVKMTDENAALVDRVFDWMRMVKKNSDEDKLPERPFTKASLECKSCPVREECWDGYVKQTQKRKGADPSPGVVYLPPLEVPK
jgi:CRISPR/Cas system-associated exonuclease Cas4 (RecB family)